MYLSVYPCDGEAPSSESEARVYFGGGRNHLDGHGFGGGHEDDGSGRGLGYPGIRWLNSFTRNRYIYRSAEYE